MGNGTSNSYFDFKMRQAREAYEEAEGLLAYDAEPRYIVNSIYYAYYYPVLGLLNVAGRSAGMQSVAIALFERLFSQTGLIDGRFFPLIRKVFNLKPKCTEPALSAIDRSTVEELLRGARDFFRAVGAAREDLTRVAGQELEKTRSERTVQTISLQ